jgi:hypothetical protein
MSWSIWTRLSFNAPENLNIVGEELEIVLNLPVLNPDGEYEMFKLNATLIPDYEPAPFTLFEFGESSPLNSVVISDVSIFIDGAGLDHRVRFVINGETVVGVVHGDTGLFNGSITGNNDTNAVFHAGFDKTSIEAIVVNGVRVDLDW